MTILLALVLPCILNIVIEYVIITSDFVGASSYYSLTLINYCEQ